ncbi:hypothetical protein PCE1_003421 [Barthelona sp. PCE]
MMLRERICLLLIALIACSFAFNTGTYNDWIDVSIAPNEAVNYVFPKTTDGDYLTSQIEFDADKTFPENCPVLIDFASEDVTGHDMLRPLDRFHSDRRANTGTNENYFYYGISPQMRDSRIGLQLISPDGNCDLSDFEDGKIQFRYRLRNDNMESIPFDGVGKLTLVENKPVFFTMTKPASDWVSATISVSDFDFGETAGDRMYLYGITTEDKLIRTLIGELYLDNILDTPFAFSDCHTFGFHGFILVAPHDLEVTLEIDLRDTHVIEYEEFTHDVDNSHELALDGYQIHKIPPSTGVLLHDVTQGGIEVFMVPSICLSSQCPQFTTVHTEDEVFFSEYQNSAFFFTDRYASQYLIVKSVSADVETVPVAFDIRFYPTKANVEQEIAVNTVVYSSVDGGRRFVFKKPLMTSDDWITIKVFSTDEADIKATLSAKTDRLPVSLEHANNFYGCELPADFYYVNVVTLKPFPVHMTVVIEKHSARKLQSHKTLTGRLSGKTCDHFTLDSNDFARVGKLTVHLYNPSNAPLTMHMSPQGITGDRSTSCMHKPIYSAPHTFNFVVPCELPLGVHHVAVCHDHRLVHDYSISVNIDEPEVIRMPVDKPFETKICNRVFLEVPDVDYAAVLEVISTTDDSLKLTAATSPFKDSRCNIVKQHGDYSCQVGDNHQCSFMVPHFKLTDGQKRRGVNDGLYLILSSTSSTSCGDEHSAVIRVSKLTNPVKTLKHGFTDVLSPYGGIHLKIPAKVNKETYGRITVYLDSDGSPTDPVVKYALTPQNYVGAFTKTDFELRKETFMYIAPCDSLKHDWYLSLYHLSGSTVKFTAVVDYVKIPTVEIDQSSLIEINDNRYEHVKFKVPPVAECESILITAQSINGFSYNVFTSFERPLAPQTCCLDDVESSVFTMSDADSHSHVLSRGLIGDHKEIFFTFSGIETEVVDFEIKCTVPSHHTIAELKTDQPNIISQNDKTYNLKALASLSNVDYLVFEANTTVNMLMAYENEPTLIDYGFTHGVPLHIPKCALMSKDLHVKISGIPDNEIVEVTVKYYTVSEYQTTQEIKDHPTGTVFYTKFTPTTTTKYPKAFRATAEMPAGVESTMFANTGFPVSLQMLCGHESAYRVDQLAGSSKKLEFEPSDIHPEMPIYFALRFETKGSDKIDFTFTITETEQMVAEIGLDNEIEVGGDSIYQWIEVSPTFDNDYDTVSVTIESEVGALRAFFFDEVGSPSVVNLYRSAFGSLTILEGKKKTFSLHTALKFYPTGFSHGEKLHVLLHPFDPATWKGRIVANNEHRIMTEWGSKTVKGTDIKTADDLVAFSTPALTNGDCFVYDSTAQALYTNYQSDYYGDFNTQGIEKFSFMRYRSSKPSFGVFAKPTFKLDDIKFTAFKVEPTYVELDIAGDVEITNSVKDFKVFRLTIPNNKQLAAIEYKLTGDSSGYLGVMPDRELPDFFSLGSSPMNTIHPDQPDFTRLTVADLRLSEELMFTDDGQMLYLYVYGLDIETPVTVTLRVLTRDVIVVTEDTSTYAVQSKLGALFKMYTEGKPSYLRFESNEKLGNYRYHKATPDDNNIVRTEDLNVAVGSIFIEIDPVFDGEDIIRDVTIIFKKVVPDESMVGFEAIKLMTLDDTTPFIRLSISYPNDFIHAIAGVRFLETDHQVTMELVTMKNGFLAESAVNSEGMHILPENVYEPDYPLPAGLYLYMYRSGNNKLENMEFFASVTRMVDFAIVDDHQLYEPFVCNSFEDDICPTYCAQSMSLNSNREVEYLKTPTGTFVNDGDVTTLHILPQLEEYGVSADAICRVEVLVTEGAVMANSHEIPVSAFWTDVTGDIAAASLEVLKIRIDQAAERISLQYRTTCQGGVVPVGSSCSCPKNCHFDVQFGEVISEYSDLVFAHYLRRYSEHDNVPLPVKMRMNGFALEGEYISDTAVVSNPMAVVRQEIMEDYKMFQSTNDLRLYLNIPFAYNQPLRGKFTELRDQYLPEPDNAYTMDRLERYVGSLHAGDFVHGLANNNDKFVRSLYIKEGSLPDHAIVNLSISDIRFFDERGFDSRDDFNPVLKVDIGKPTTGNYFDSLQFDLQFNKDGYHMISADELKTRVIRVFTDDERMVSFKVGFHIIEKEHKVIPSDGKRHCLTVNGGYFIGKLPKVSRDPSKYISVVFNEPTTTQHIELFGAWGTIPTPTQNDFKLGLMHPTSKDFHCAPEQDIYFMLRAPIVGKYDACITVEHISLSKADIAIETQVLSERDFSLKTFVPQTSHFFEIIRNDIFIEITHPGKTWSETVIDVDVSVDLIVDYDDAVVTLLGKSTDTHLECGAYYQIATAMYSDSIEFIVKDLDSNVDKLFLHFPTVRSFSVGAYSLNEVGEIKGEFGTEYKNVATSAYAQETRYTFELGSSVDNVNEYIQFEVSGPQVKFVVTTDSCSLTPVVIPSYDSRKTVMRVYKEDFQNICNRQAGIFTREYPTLLHVGVRNRAANAYSLKITTGSTETIKANLDEIATLTTNGLDAGIWEYTVPTTTDFDKEYLYLRLFNGFKTIEKLDNMPHDLSLRMYSSTQIKENLPPKRISFESDQDWPNRESAEANDLPINAGDKIYVIMAFDIDGLPEPDAVVRATTSILFVHGTVEAVTDVKSIEATFKSAYKVLSIPSDQAFDVLVADEDTAQELSLYLVADGFHTKHQHTRKYLPNTDRYEQTGRFVVTTDAITTSRSLMLVIKRPDYNSRLDVTYAPIKPAKPTNAEFCSGFTEKYSMSMLTGIRDNEAEMRFKRWVYSFIPWKTESTRYYRTTEKCAADLKKLSCLLSYPPVTSKGNMKYYPSELGENIYKHCYSRRLNIFDEEADPAMSLFDASSTYSLKWITPGPGKEPTSMMLYFFVAIIVIVVLVAIFVTLKKSGSGTGKKREKTDAILSGYTPADELTESLI